MSLNFLSQISWQFQVDAARKNNTIIINKKTSRKRKQSE